MIDHRHPGCPDCQSLGVLAEVEGRRAHASWERTRGDHWAQYTHQEPVLRIRELRAEHPRLRVIAPFLIHAGQTIEINLTTGELTIKETP